MPNSSERSFHDNETLPSPSIFSALFVDCKPSWRTARYAHTLNSLKIALTRDPLWEIELKEWVNSSSQNTLQKEIQEASLLLLKTTNQTAEEDYHSFLSHLRKALGSNEYKEGYEKLLNRSSLSQQDKSAIQTVHLLCIAFYTKITLHPFCKELIVLMQKAGGFSSPTQDSFREHFHQVRLAIEMAPLHLKIPIYQRFIQAFISQINFNYDPYTQENTPYLLFELISLNPAGVKKTIPALRLGTPTQENSWATFTKQASITPEFRGYLQAYQLQGKKHLYINLQNRNTRSFGFNEAPRCKSIEQLSQEFPYTCSVMTLAKNTHFYHQKDTFSHLKLATDFIEALTKQINDPAGGFFFSDNLRLAFAPSFDARIAELLTKTHREFFHAKAELSKQERLDFIELFYTLLQEAAIECLHPDSYNTSCKDGIDRAGGANALMYLYQVVKEENHLSNEQLENLKAVLFAPAIIVKKRAIADSRFLRFVSAANRLLKYHEP